jgi:hypothetical protein
LDERGHDSGTRIWDEINFWCGHVVGRESGMRFWGDSDSGDRVILVISVIPENERQQGATRPIMTNESPFGISDRD